MSSGLDLDRSLPRVTCLAVARVWVVRAGWTHSRRELDGDWLVADARRFGGTELGAGRKNASAQKTNGTSILVERLYSG